MADGEKKVIYKVEIDESDANASSKKLAITLETLTKANKDLRAERAKVDTQSIEGRKRIAEINSELDKNNKLIKDNSSALEKQKLNIGNYAGAIDKLIPGFDGLRAAITGSQTAFQGLTKAATSATVAEYLFLLPIGLIIAAGLSIYAFFARTEKGADMIAKAIQQVSAVVGVLLDRFTALGSSLVSLFSGDSEEAARQYQSAISGVGDEIAREVRLAGELADLLDRLEDLERSNEVSISGTTLAVKRLIIESKNRNLTEQERIDKLKEASALESAASEQTRIIKLYELKAVERQIELDFSQFDIKKKLYENDLDFAKRILQSDDVTASSKDKIAEAIKAYNTALGESANIQEKIANAQDALDQKQEESSKKKADLAKAQADADRRASSGSGPETNSLDGLQAFADGRAEIQKGQVNTEKTFADISLGITKAANQGKLDSEKFFNTEYQNILKERADAEMAFNQFKISSLDNLAGGLQAAFGRNKVLALGALALEKGAAIGQVAANTGIANAKAVGFSPLTFGQPWVAINSIAAGLNIASILRSFTQATSEVSAAAGGGNFLTKGPTMLLVGDNPGGVERVTVEPLSGKGQTKVRGNGLIQMAGGGSLTTQPSAPFQTSFIAGQLNTERLMNGMIDQIRKIPRVAVVIEDVNRLNDQRAEITEAARLR